MSEDRYQRLQDAITKARAETSCYIDLNCCYDCKERYAHLDTLTDILNLAADLDRMYVNVPQDLRATVTTALRKMGAL